MSSLVKMPSATRASGGVSNMLAEKVQVGFGRCWRQLTHVKAAGSAWVDSRVEDTDSVGRH
jgi:hypothetical protein